MSITNQFLTLSAVAFVMTCLVYGTVALIVKADDYGAFLVRTARAPSFGKLIVKFMPHFLRFLKVIGTVAMLWAGGSVISHSIEYMGTRSHSDLMHAMIDATGFTHFLKWLAEKLLYACFGLIIGPAVQPLGKVIQH